MSEAMDTLTSQDPGPSSHSSRGKQNFAVRRPRGSRGRGSRRGHPNDRTNTWRDVQNRKVVAEEDAARNARFAKIGLAPDLSQASHPSTARTTSTPEYSSVQFLGVALTSYARPLPISTQAVGFIVNQYYIKLQDQLGAERVSAKCSVHQLYRHSLAQLSYHLYRLRVEVASRYSFVSAYPDPPVIPVDFLECFKTLELNIGYITSYIQRIGCVIANDVPVVPMLTFDDSPLYVNIFNLRRTLDGLARNDDRFNDFIARNPIPGLAVTNNRLTNIEAVMPRDYNAAVAYRDSNAVKALMNYTAAKMRDVVTYTGRLGQIGEGSPAMLLSSTSYPDGPLEIRIPTTPLGNLQPIVGTVENFWCDYRLTDESTRLGVLGLYVREDASLAQTPTGNQWLNSAVANYQISADYAAFLHRLIG